MGPWLTDTDGEIPQQTVTAGFYNQTGGNTIYSYNPYQIDITKDGYITYSRNFTQLEEKSWNIALLPTTPVNTANYMLIGSMLSTPIMLAIALHQRKQHKTPKTK